MSGNAAAEVAASNTPRTLSSRAPFFRVLLVALSVALAAASPTRAQVVRGSVIDDQGQPVATALLVLLDGDGSRQAATLSDRSGGFIIRAPAPGTYRLRVERIGYRTSEGQAIELRAGEVVERRILAPTAPVELPGLTAEAERRCTSRPAEGEAVAVLWQEVRKGLQTSQLSDASHAYSFRTARWVRRLKLPGLAVLSDSSHEQVERGQGSPFVSAPVEQLLERGFIVPAPDGGTVYFGPDAAVLLSDAFANSYCLSPVQDAEHGRVGIRFRPVSRTGPPAVTGTLWLDRGTFELRQLVYGYTRVILPQGPMREVGGSVDFERLPDGTWVVRRWQIRMPLPGHPQRELGRAWVFQTAPDGIREEGGEILEVVPLEVVTEQTLRGRLTNPAGEPVPGALFTLLDQAGLPTGAAITDGGGEFSFSPREAGRYSLRVERIGQDAVTGEQFAIEPGTTLTVALQVSSQAPGLGDVRAESGRCVPGASPGPVAELWLHAATFLRIAAQAEEQGLAPVRGIKYLRLLDSASRPNRGIVDEERFIGPRMSFPAMPPDDSLAFAAPDSNATVQYRVPSPAVLLSPAFLDGHCINEVVTEPSHPEWVGLRFGPVPENESIGVEGVLWLDRASAGVTSLEYGYRAGRGGSPLDGIRGLVGFATGADGLPRVSRWWLRVPRVFETVGADGRTERRPMPMESGAIVLGAEDEPVQDPEGLFEEIAGAIKLDPLVVEAKRAEFEAVLDARPWRFTRSATSVVRPAELLGAPPGSALDIVKALRARWLVPQPGSLSRDIMPAVYLDDMRLTRPNAKVEDVEAALRQIPGTWVGAIERIRSIEAAMMYGAVEIGVGGVILVYSRRW